MATLPPKVRKVRNACLEAARYYKPRAYPGRVILFRSSREPVGGSRDPYAGWGKYLSNGLEVYDVKSDHDNILLEPQVRLVADQVRTCLEAAQALHHDSQPLSVETVNAGIRQLA